MPGIGPKCVLVNTKAFLIVFVRFELMDIDKRLGFVDSDGDFAALLARSGSLTPIEFLTGLFKVKGPAKGQDLCRLIMLVEKNKLIASKWVKRMRPGS